MPNHGSGVKTDFPAALGQTPAEIDVVSRRAEYRIEAAHRQQCILSEGAVAARNVLGFASRQSKHAPDLPAHAPHIPRYDRLRPEECSGRRRLHSRWSGRSKPGIAASADLDMHHRLCRRRCFRGPRASRCCEPNSSRDSRSLSSVPRYFETISAVLSVEPSSTTMTS